MSLIPDNPKQDSHASPACKLHKKFQRTSALPKSSNTSKQADFTALLKRVPYDEIDSLLTWLAKQPASAREFGSGLFVVKYDELLAKKRAELSEYPTTPLAEELATVIGQQADYIEPEYVQHALDNYAKFLQFLKEQPDDIAKLVYDQLPPPRDFVLLWFGKIVSTFSKKFRKFDVFNPRFQQFILKLGEGQSRAIIQVIVRFDEKYQALANKRPELR